MANERNNRKRKADELAEREACRMVTRLRPRDPPPAPSPAKKPRRNAAKKKVAKKGRRATPAADRLVRRARGTDQCMDCAIRNAAKPPGEPLFDRLPEEMLDHVFSFMSLPEVVGVERVCTRWQQSAQTYLNRYTDLDMSEWVEVYPVPRAVLRWLLPRMPNLKRLRVSAYGIQWRPQVDWGRLEPDLLGYACPLLTHISLVGFKIAPKLVRELCEACPKLEDVTLAPRVTNAVVKMLLQSLPGLRVLHVRDSYVSNAAFELMPASLESLTVQGCHVSDFIEPDQQFAFTKLTHLNVASFMELTTDALTSILSQTPLLEKLALPSIDLRPERCLPQEGAPVLRHLDLEANGGVTDRTLAWLASKCPKLETLNIGLCNNLTEDGLTASLGCFPKLRVLQLGYLGCVTDAVLESLHESKLQELSMEIDDKFTMDGVGKLKKACATLKSIKIIS